MSAPSTQVTPSKTSIQALLQQHIRDVPDFPKPGIVFKDITPVLQNGPVFHQVIDALVARYQNRDVSLIAGIESRGFIFASALAYALGKGLVIARKKGKLPAKTKSWTYDLEYGTDTLEIHEDAISAKERVVLIDDVLATGGTALATTQLIEQMGGVVVESGFVIELGFLGGREKMGAREVFSLVSYE